jgi:hypothetical protein
VALPWHYVVVLVVVATLHVVVSKNFINNIVVVVFFAEHKLCGYRVVATVGVLDAKHGLKVFMPHPQNQNQWFGVLAVDAAINFPSLCVYKNKVQLQHVTNQFNHDFVSPVRIFAKLLFQFV